MSFVPMFPVYVNFTFHVNSQRLYLRGELKKQVIFCVSTKYWGSYDVTSV